MGTNVRKAWDTSRLARALAMPGIDPRHWVSYGTVGVVDDDGHFDPTNKHAVYVGPEGIEVDVLLEPLDLPVTAHFAGAAGGRSATILTPVKPGDRVLVCLPDGDPAQPPVIVAILHSSSVPVPLGPDRLPIYRNDRIFIWATDVDVDVRTKNGARLQVKQDGTFLLGDGATEQVIKGTSYRSDENALLTGTLSLLTAFTTLEAAAVGPLAALKPGFIAAKEALQQFKDAASAAGDYLSDVSKTK